MGRSSQGTQDPGTCQRWFDQSLNQTAGAQGIFAKLATTPEMAAEMYSGQPVDGR